MLENVGSEAIFDEVGDSAKYTYVESRIITGDKKPGQKNSAMEKVDGRRLKIYLRSRHGGVG